MNTSWLLWTTLFSAVALGFLTYAKKQRSPLPLLIGTGLLIVPYVINNLYLMIIISVILIILPYFLKS
ncbi:MAG: hypothetical protein RL637_1053 [Pseudomonadota bacterium]|jgi:predicted membrane protein